MTEKIKKKSRFWLGFRIYMGILAVLVIVLLIYVWNTMKKYEKAQPEQVVGQIAQELENGDVSSIGDTTSNKFESAEEYTDIFVESVKGKELTYAKDADSYDSQAPVYDIISGENIVAKVTLKETRHYTKMAILAMSDWEVSTVEAMVSGGSNNVKVTVPSSYKVSINGVELGEEEQSGEAKEMEGFTYVAEYVAVPKTITYEVKGLLNIPQLAVTDAAGNNVDVSSYTDYSDVNMGYAVSEMPAELKEYVIKASEDYSNFFSRDLNGCGESTACLQPYFPEGSYYIDMAETYRQEDMWMFSKHNAPVFSNVNVSNYIQYSDDCFSCEVQFDKTMVLTMNGQTRVDHNDQTFYYVLINGKWLIADIKDVL